MRPAAERRGIVAMADELWIPRICQIVNGEAPVAPRCVAKMSCTDEMMQRRALAKRSGRRLAAGTVHAWQPPPSRQFWPGGIRHVDDCQSVIDEAFEMDRHVGIAAANPPDAVRAETGHVQERNLARGCRNRDVKDAQARCERLFGLHRID